MSGLNSSALLQESIYRLLPNMSQDAFENGSTAFESCNWDAKEHLLLPGTTCEYLYFIDQSVTRCYYLNEDEEEHTLWMKPKQLFLTEYQSFSSGKKSRFGLQVYEKSTGHRISRDSIEHLMNQFIEWAQWNQHLVQASHVKLIEVFVNLLANDATTNYQYIEWQFPEFLKVAPLKHIASMLQVSPVTLSRIRAGTQTKPS